MDLYEYPIGNFDVVSGKITISDPCYKDGLEIGVKNGKWEVDAELQDHDNNTNVFGLIALHQDSSNTKDVQWQLFDGVPVDSGQAGIYDSAHYRDDSVIKETPKFLRLLTDKKEEGLRWYAANCDLTLSREEIQAGVLPFGCVSSSGYGDGVYDVYISKNENDEVVSIKISFVDETICSENEFCDECGYRMYECICDDEEDEEKEEE